MESNSNLFNTTTVSAPGKIHLLGEHVVVYGKPALIAAIDKRLYATIKIKKPKIKINSDDKLIKKSIQVFKNAFKIKDLPSLELTINSQIPVGSGLGSSAALSVAVIGALMKAVLNIWNPTKINELAFEVEKFQHGNPSGGDNTAITFGGLVWYRKEFDFLKSIWNLPIANYKIPPFMIIDSGRPEETTGEMVKSVSRLNQRNKKRFESILSDQEKRTKNLLLGLKIGDKKEIKESIRLGEKNLERLKVVGIFAQKIIREAENIGGSLKISGAGGRKKGSGMLLCYHEDISGISTICRKHKVLMFPVKLGQEGIRIESTNYPISL